MKKCIGICIALFGIAAFGGEKNVLTNLDFVAPTVYDVENVPNPEGGLILFDSKDHVFKGKSWIGGWQTLGSSAASVNYLAVNSNYSPSSFDDVITTSGTLTLTLPSASSLPGKTYEIKKTDSTSTTVTINTSGTDVYDGATETTTKVELHSKNDSLKLVSNGSNKWVLIADGRVVAARAYRSTTQSIPASTVTIVDYNIVEIDTHNAITTGSNWIFTAPIAGKYLVIANMRFDAGVFTANNLQQISVYKNTSLYTYLNLYYHQVNYTGYPSSINGTTIMDLSAGDVVDMRASQTESSARNLIGSGNFNYVAITRIK